MIKKTSLSVLVTCLLLFLLSLGLVQAGSGLTVLSSTAEVDFPSRLNFSLSVESNVNIADIRLHYRVDRMDFAEVTSEVYIKFEPDTVVEAEWIWDMRKTGGLPPGSSVEYWWTVEDAKDNKIKTDPARVWFEDNRYQWHNLKQGKVTLYWYKGDDSFAQELMTTAQRVLAWLDEYTGAELEKPVGIYIYADAGDLRGSMIFPQEWTGGVAFTRYGIIAIGIAPNSLDWGSRVIAHELTHLVIHQMTFNPYGDLPTWLDEGLAMYAEGDLIPFYAAILGNAVTEGSLISVRSLSSPFSAYAEESSLAYAQSYSLLEFLIDNYGQRKMFELLNTFEKGSGYDEALVKVYGFDMDGLDALWREYITSGSLAVQPAAEVKEGMPPVVIGILAVLATGLIVGFSVMVLRAKR